MKGGAKDVVPVDEADPRVMQPCRINRSDQIGLKLVEIGERLRRRHGVNEHPRLEGRQLVGVCYQPRSNRLQWWACGDAAKYT